jgi:hypothetical protein
MKGMNQCKVYFMFLWKYHKETHVQLFETNKNLKKDKIRRPSQIMRQIFLLNPKSVPASALVLK